MTGERAVAVDGALSFSAGAASRWRGGGICDLG